MANTSAKPIPYHIFVQDRESEQWFYEGRTQSHTEKEWIGGSNRKRSVIRYDGYTWPKPERVSAFIKAHKIIQAETEEEAWQILKSK